MHVFVWRAIIHRCLATTRRAFRSRSSAGTGAGASSSATRGLLRLLLMADRLAAFALASNALCSSSGRSHEDPPVSSSIGCQL